MCATGFGLDRLLYVADRRPLGAWHPHRRGELRRSAGPPQVEHQPASDGLRDSGAVVVLTSDSARSMPAVTPADVQTFSELRTKIGSGSTVMEENSRAICPAKAQCVVATQPSINPADAARNDPVQTLTTRWVCSAAICIQPTVSALLRAWSTPMPPGSTRVSMGSRGSGRGWATSARPVRVVAGSPLRETTVTE